MIYSSKEKIYKYQKKNCKHDNSFNYRQNFWRKKKHNTDTNDNYCSQPTKRTNTKAQKKITFFIIQKDQRGKPSNTLAIASQYYTCQGLGFRVLFSNPPQGRTNKDINSDHFGIRRSRQFLRHFFCFIGFYFCSYKACLLVFLFKKTK